MSTQDRDRTIVNEFFQQNQYTLDIERSSVVLDDAGQVIKLSLFDAFFYEIPDEPIEARLNFVRVGVSDDRFINKVRAPQLEEIPAEYAREPYMNFGTYWMR